MHQASKARVVLAAYINEQSNLPQKPGEGESIKFQIGKAVICGEQGSEYNAGGIAFNIFVPI
jgi:hypothetical protein